KSGFAVDEKTSSDQVQAVLNLYGPAREIMLKEPDRIPDPTVSVSYALLGLAAERHPADATTEAMAKLISMHQAPDGHFRAFTVRPPIESSEFTATALTVRAMQVYGKDSDKAIAMAREWLQSAKPRTHEDSVMRLLGLTWSKADAPYLRDA